MANYKIIDVSKYQKNIDFVKVADQIDGAIIRVGLSGYIYFKQQIDEYFEKNYKGFKAAGVPLGCYFYSTAKTVDERRVERQFVLNAIKDKQFELPVYLDYENTKRRVVGNSKETITQIIDTFLSIVENEKYFVGLYSYTVFINKYIDIDTISKKYSIWLADYRTLPNRTIPRDALQYTSTGKIDGIDGDVDISTFYKDFTTIIKGANLNGFGTNTTSNIVDYKAQIREKIDRIDALIKDIKELLNNE